jgi:putative aldouronate transport system permease protein
MQIKFSISRLFLHMTLIFLTIFFVAPVLLIIPVSLTPEMSILENGYRFFPKTITFDAYNLVFSNSDVLLNSYKVSLIVAGVGTFLNIVFTGMFSFAITRKEFKLRKIVSFMAVFTMLFSGGLVSTYILMTQYLKLQDTYWVLILSIFANVWYIFIFRSFFQDIPESIVESALIDGAGMLRIFINIIIPLSKPVIAALSLFVMLDYWNDWFSAMLYINNDELVPLQYMLQKIMLNVQSILNNLDNIPADMVDLTNLPQENFRMAMVVLAAGPMLIIFPFFQKYFSRGITLGSVKG